MDKPEDQISSGGVWLLATSPSWSGGRYWLWCRCAPDGTTSGPWEEVGTDQHLRDFRTAITAALGDGAIVVDTRRLREALEYACHWGMQQNRSQPWAEFVTAAQSYADATIAELTAPEVEG